MRCAPRSSCSGGVRGRTEWYWQTDLHNFLHMCKLRLDPHAQYEIRVYAKAMLDLARPHFPTAIAAWEGALQPA